MTDDIKPNGTKENTTAYPLAWPEGWSRRPLYEQINPYSRFGKLTIDRARRRLYDELRLLGATDVVLSSNLTLRNDGEPYSSQRRPYDSGVAVYFVRDGRQLVMAHDKWARVEANINALALAVDGLRQMERHGGAVMLERAFSGFEALPHLEPEAEPKWQAVLQVANTAYTLDECERNFRLLSREAHPDRGGSDELMQRLLWARNQARKELMG